MPQDSLTHTQLGIPDSTPPESALVRNEFYRQYPAEGDEKQKTATRRQAFYRAVKDAQDKGLVATREVEGVQLIWRTRPEAP